MTDPTVLLLIALVGFVWLRHLWKRLVQSNEAAEREKRAEALRGSGIHGTARWGDLDDARRQDLLGPIRPGSALCLLGRPPQPAPGALGIARDTNLMTIAPAGSGKSTGVLVPNLLTHTASCLVTDPKGELAAITHRARRAMGHRILMLNPWRLHGLGCDGFNPLQGMDAEDPDTISALRSIADALIVAEGRSDDGHWEREARALIAGFLLHLVATEDAPERRSLITLRRWLMLAPAERDGLIAEMEESPLPLVREAAARLMQKAEKERSAVFSTAQGQTDFLDDPRLVETLSRSDFRPEDLKTQPVTVYLMLPAYELGNHFRWLRLVIAQTLRALQRDPAHPTLPVVFYLDEIAALGRLNVVREAYGLARGFGVRIWSFWQDVSQVKRLYGPDGWETFVANSGALQVFGVADQGTADLISRMLGNRTEVAPGFNIGRRGELNEAQETTGSGDSFSAVGRPLLTADEVRRLPRDRQIVLVQGAAPFRLPRLDYRSDPELVGYADPNPLHAGAAMPDDGGEMPVSPRKGRGRSGKG